MALSDTIPLVPALPAVALRRLLIGLAQGILLYLMFKAAEMKTWPATDVILYETLLLPLLFAPLAAIHADTHLPRRGYLVWIAAVTVTCALLGLFDGYQFAERFFGIDGPLKWPVFMVTAIGLFIAEALVLAAAADGRRIADYPTYFDAAWKHGVQLAAGLGFVGALWLLLFMGAELFKLIKLDFPSKTIEQTWFIIPVTAMALAISIHMTDVQAGLVRGIRTLALTLLSWLLPVLFLIAAGFLVSLPFTGLQPLWDTRFAAALLLAVSAALVILINAAYQDGQSENKPVLRWTMTGAMVLPLPLIGIAAFALVLRVQQYGWTVDRVFALACIVVGACYGIGYLAAAVQPAAMRARLERTNVATSLIVLVIMVALFTPIANPTRISVNSQVDRLEDGKVSAEQFDYTYLRFQAGKFGADALARMKNGDIQIAGVADRAAQALDLTDRFAAGPPDEKALALNITAADGRALPASFLAQDWSVTAKEHAVIPHCLRDKTGKCEAFFLDFDRDRAEEIVLISPDDGTPPTIFRLNGEQWARIGELPRRLACDDMKALLKAGAVQTLPSRWSDLEIGGVRMDVAENSVLEPQGCDAPR